ncbi:MAG TPA: response regulator [Pyrinomonadaceae bacterium]|nr:response regulator [Pyrinomonadaceae bacterium]
MPRILIVEDEPTIRNILSETLSSKYECHAVRTAEEGLKLLSDYPFDAAITDVKLPGMGGEDFLRAAHELNPDLPVIVISGGYGGHETKFVEAGAFGYLLKPFRFEEVEEMVRRAVSSRE